MEEIHEATTQQIIKYGLKQAVVNLGFRAQGNGQIKYTTITRFGRSTSGALVSTNQTGIYICNLCHERFSRPKKLRHHIIHNHLPPNRTSRSKFECLECYKVYSQCKYLNLHWKHHWAIKPYPCTVPGCKQYSVTRHGYRTHLKTHSTLKPYKCNSCNAKFKQKVGFHIHKLRSRRAGLKCGICHLKFCNRLLYDSHLKNHKKTGPKLYHCKICGESIVRKLLSKHMEVHSNADNRPHKCSLCSKTFKESTTLEYHMRSHTGEKPYECQVCKKRFSQTSNLRTHSKVHKNPDKKFQCSVCYKKSDNEIGSRKHEIMCGKISEYAIEIHAPYTPKKTVRSSAKRSVVSYQCRQCNCKIFKRKGYLQDHVFRYHLKLKLFKCTYCDKKFVIKQGLETHLRSHTGEEPFKCKICGKQFKQDAHLKSHSATHTDERKFECSHCPKSFNSQTILNGHIRLHTKELPYQCTICPMAFPRSDVLKRHVNNHTGNRAFKCKEAGCSKAFLTNQELVLHKRSHTDERPFPCPVCDVSFRTNYKLKQHFESQKHKKMERLHRFRNRRN